MFTTKKNTLAILLLSLIIMTAGCSDDSTGPDTNEGYDASAILQNEANNVILPTYKNLNNEAGKLEVKVKAFQTNKTQAKLKAARKQWRNTRKPWESSEAFLFGPVESAQVDPHIDSWPLNKADLDNILSNKQKLTKEYIQNQNNGLKGFHTIEYLLFGGYKKDKQAEDFTDREINYMLSTTQALKAATQLLVDKWSSSGGNWTQKLANAGNGSKQFASSKAAIQRLISFDNGGMGGIINEVANEKIDNPLSEGNYKLVESQFSFNSKVDFQHNIQSAIHIYTGDYNGHEGPGITDIIQEKKPALDTRFRKEYQNAIEAIGDIKGEFRDAITDHQQSVKKAQKAVRKVRKTLLNDISPIISNTTFK